MLAVETKATNQEMSSDINNKVVVHTVTDSEYGTRVTLFQQFGRFYLQLFPPTNKELMPTLVELHHHQFESLSKIASNETNEIEKKFKIAVLPTGLLEKGIKSHIQQDYLAIDDNGAEVRVRSEIIAGGMPEYTLTFKIGSGLVRGEAQADLSKEQYDELREFANGSVEKDRFTLPANLFLNDNGVKSFEFDRLLGTHQGLFLLETEMQDPASVSAIENAVMEAFPGSEDVTGVKAYKAAKLARSFHI